MSARLESSTFLFDVPPLIMEAFCKIMDSGPDSLGWKGLAARILPSWLDVRCTEMHAAAGRSPTHELVWSWAQQNKTVGDLLKVLEDMGHYRAHSLFQCQDSYKPVPLLQTNISSASEIIKTQTSREELSPVSEPLPDCSFARRHVALITYSEVIEGTRNFHQDLKIRDSTFSELYRGRRGNEYFAVKVFKQVKKELWKTLWEKFKTEIEVLQLYQHPNILQLWGSFSEGDQYCLVHPFMSYGSLFNRLHSEETGCDLLWQKRLDIIKGTARAVYHLHTAQPCMVICGNITSANILLDENMQPKLSDFGMARLRPHSVNQSCTITMDRASRSNLGYLPEEYIRDGKLSVKLDIYSLGTVILETCTGRKVMLEEPKPTLLRDVLSLEAEEKGSVDACLSFLDSKAGRWPTATALCLLRLGLECTSSRARARPNMETVLEKLSQLLPLPFPPEDQPRTLDDTAPPLRPFGAVAPIYSLPMEDDEIKGPLEKPEFPEHFGPCECSQSEVIFLGNGLRSDSSSSAHAVKNSREAGAEAGLPMGREPTELDLYGSWPVECSCTSETETQGCEDCWANGFSNTSSFIPKGEGSPPPQTTVENPAKVRLTHKIQLYNQGIIKTEELLSMTSK